MDILDKLEADGWSHSVDTIDAGGYKREAKYTVTLSRNGNEFSTRYTSGWGNRVWKKGCRHISDYWRGYRKPGQPVTTSFYGTGSGIPGKLKPVEDCTPSRRDQQRDIFAEYERITEPVLPTLPDVLHALVSDAQCVCNGQTFEDFCNDLGYDDDSRRAETCFNGCRDSWCGLIRMGVDLDELGELFQDY